MAPSRSTTPAGTRSGSRPGSAPAAPPTTVPSKSRAELVQDVLNKYMPVVPQGLYDDPINLGTSMGQKLFRAATVFKIEDKDIISLDTSNKDKAIRLLRKLSKEYCWNVILDDFPRKDVNILTKPKLSTLAEIRTASAAYWAPNSNDPGNATEVEDLATGIIQEQRTSIQAYFSRIRSLMISKAIFAHFREADLDSLVKRYGDFVIWNDPLRNCKVLDGPSLLKVLLDKLNPATVGQINALRTKAREIRLSSFNHDVNNMITELTAIRTQIDDLGGSFDDYMNVCFSALLSGHNASFNNLIAAKQSEYYMGAYTDPAALLSFAEATYNNFVTSGTWNKPSPETIIAALATELRALKAAGKANVNTSNSNNNNTSSFIADWRYTKTEPMVNRDGKTFHWCPKHKGKNGEMTGLYVTHKPEDHDEWVANKKKPFSQRRAKATGSSVSTSDSTVITSNRQSDKDTSKLQLDPSLQSALVTGAFLDSLVDDEQVN